MLMIALPMVFAVAGVSYYGLDMFVLPCLRKLVFRGATREATTPAAVRA